MNSIAGSLPDADPMAWVAACTIAVGLGFALLAVRHVLVGRLTAFARRTATPVDGEPRAMTEWREPNE